MEFQTARFRKHRFWCSATAATWCLLAILSAVGLAGCGTTRSSDTKRTATEQVLISDAIDRAVVALKVHRLSGQSIYFDDRYLYDAVDSGYLISSIRQHLLANGCILKDERTEADFVVEGRSGAIGTNRHDLLFGIPSTNVPQIFPLQGIPAAIPEVPFAKRRDQRGVAKIALFAYHRETGRPVWQSGIALQESTLNDVWVLGAGPFQHGTIREGASFAGQQIDGSSGQGETPKLASISKETTFANPAALTGKLRRIPATEGPVADSGLRLADHTLEAAPLVDRPVGSPGGAPSGPGDSGAQISTATDERLPPADFTPPEDCPLLPPPLTTSSE